MLFLLRFVCNNLKCYNIFGMHERSPVSSFLFSFTYFVSCNGLRAPIEKWQGKEHIIIRGTLVFCRWNLMVTALLTSMSTGCVRIWALYPRNLFSLAVASETTSAWVSLMPQMRKSFKLPKMPMLTALYPACQRSVTTTMDCVQHVESQRPLQC